MSSKYLLDANTLIEAKDRYYAFDICRGFWQALVSQNDARRVFSIDRIKVELLEQDDAIKTWIQESFTEPDSFSKQTQDRRVIHKFSELMNWVQSQPQLTSAAKSEFATVADGWVIAYAAVNELVVVTQEQPAPESRRKVKIPDVCIEFDVPYVNTFEMLRQLGECFGRRTRRG